MDRRSFIKSGLILTGVASAAGGLSYLYQQSENSLSGIYFNIDYRPDGKDFNYLVIWDFAKGTSKEFPIYIDPHSVMLSNTEPHKCLMIEKWDRKIALLDTIDGKEVARFEHTPESHRQFIGHALYSNDGKYIFTSEAVFDEKGPKEKYAQGFIGVRDAQTLKLVKEYSSFGLDPHEMLFLKDGKTILVCNQGHYLTGRDSKYRNLAYINSETGELIELVEVPQNLSPAHLRRFGDDHFVIVTRSLDFHNLFEQDQHLLVKMKNSPVEVLPIPDELKNKLSKELLSLAVSEKYNVVATTYPDGKKVIFWDLKNKAFLKSVDTGTVTGVTLTLEGEHFLVNDLDRGLLVFDVKHQKQTDLSSLEFVRGRKLDMPHSYLTYHPGE